MSSSVDTDERQYADPEHCLPTKLIEPIAGTYSYVACLPTDGDPLPNSWRCNVPFPGRITVSWTRGDDKRGYWPLSLIIPSGSDIPTVTVVSANGSLDSLSLDFVLDGEIAKAYYSAIGPERDWIASRDPNAPNGGFDLAKINSLAGDLYSVESVKTGTQLTATTYTYLKGYNNDGFGGVILACEEQLTDLSTFKNIITGDIRVFCNLVDVRSNGPTLRDENGQASLNVAAAVEGTIAAGFITENHSPNPKLSVRHLVCMGLLPTTAFKAPVMYYKDLFFGVGFPPIVVPMFNESALAAAGIGWPCYGLALFSAILNVNGSGRITFSQAQNGFSTHNAENTVDGYPAIVEPVVFSISSSG